MEINNLTREIFTYIIIQLYKLFLPKNGKMLWSALQQRAVYKKLI